MLGEIFKALLITSLAGTCLAAAITLTRPVTKKVFGYSWHYYIWLAVLLVMILPVRFRLPKMVESISSTVDVVQTMQTNQTEIQTAQNVKTSAAEQNTAPAKVWTNPDTDIAADETLAKMERREKGMNVAAVLWLAGVVTMLFVNIIGYIRLIRKMRRRSTVVSCPEIADFTKRKLTARVWENMSSPFVTGIFKPTLVLPAVELTEEQLNNILRHEMTHFNRHDILYKWLTVIVKCLHWFNPMIWYMTKQINTECEISCDMSVVKEMSLEEERSYINTILALLPRGKSKQIPLTTQMASSKRILKRRFEMIKNKKKTSRFMSVLSAATAAVMLGMAVFAGGVFANEILNDKMSSWAKSDIDKANEYLIVYDEMNITDYTENITREGLCDLIGNVFVNNGVTLTAWRYPFTDLNNDLESIIHSLYCMGIVNGKTETEFGPTDYVTREEAAAIIYRAFRYTGLMEAYANDEARNYRYADDKSISDWAKDAVYGLRILGIMNGVGGDSFNPKSNVTIEQATSSLVKLYEILEDTNLEVRAKTRARQNVRVFFSWFNQGAFDIMKSLCTERCVNDFFGDGYVFGMTQAGLDKIDFVSDERLNAEGKAAVQVSVYMTPHENSVYGPGQTTATFYMILAKQQDGSYLIDEFATGL